MTSSKSLRVLVTGARGGVGACTVRALGDAGHNVVATDRLPPLRDDWGDGIQYYDADLTDAGSAFAIVRGVDAVVHAGAIPTPEFHPPHAVFANNLVATFNVLEAAVRWGVSRFVNVSSESVLGTVFAERPMLPDYVPIDESHPVRPQDPYALAKHFGEQLADAAVRRSDIRCISIRPSWVQHPGDYAVHLAPARRDPAAGRANAWGYVDADDLADALVLAVECDLPGHEVFNIAAPDDVPGLPLADLVEVHYGDRVELRAVARDDASGITCAKAERLLGYAPERSWRDYLDEEGNPRK
jgi:nucleoside-diphosphate-sugar epimerase